MLDEKLGGWLGECLGEWFGKMLCYRLSKMLELGERVDERLCAWLCKRSG